MTAPVASTSGPPELPGLTAASVWSALMNELSPPPLPLPDVTGRFFALIMPLVTVPESPNGDPIAITASPTSTLSLSPNCKADKPVRAILITAKS